MHSGSDPANRASDVPARERPAWPASKSVLVVDDDPEICEVVQNILAAQGIPARVASGRESAKRLLREDPRIAIILLDRFLRGYGGEEVFRDLVALDADVKVVFCSGMPPEPHCPIAGHAAYAGFLQKPYTPAQLVDVLLQSLR